MELYLIEYFRYSLMVLCYPKDLWAFVATTVNQGYRQTDLPVLVTLVTDQTRFTEEER